MDTSAQLNLSIDALQKKLDTTTQAKKRYRVMFFMSFLTLCILLGAIYKRTVLDYASLDNVTRWEEAGQGKAMPGAVALLQELAALLIETFKIIEVQRVAAILEHLTDLVEMFAHKFDIQQCSHTPL